MRTLELLKEWKVFAGDNNVMRYRGLAKLLNTPSEKFTALKIWRVARSNEGELRTLHGVFPVVDSVTVSLNYG